MPLNEENLYIYRARVTRVIDGDTVEADVDLGFSVKISTKLRLYGIDAPEIRGKEKEKGAESRDHLIKLTFLYALNRRHGKIRGFPSLIIRTHKDKTGKYGRMLGELVGVEDDVPVNLNEKMVEDSFATAREK